MSSGQSKQTKKFTAVLTQEDGWHIAQCLEVDVASQGESEANALANLKEALELIVEEPTLATAPRIAQFEVDTSPA